ncbi:unnamed protein product, partial [Iphiclides podalirius]
MCVRSRWPKAEAAVLRRATTKAAHMSRNVQTRGGRRQKPSDPFGPPQSDCAVNVDHSGMRMTDRIKADCVSSDYLHVISANGAGSSFGGGLPQLELPDEKQRLRRSRRGLPRRQRHQSGQSASDVTKGATASLRGAVAALSAPTGRARSAGEFPSRSSPAWHSAPPKRSTRPPETPEWAQRR